MTDDYLRKIIKSTYNYRSKFFHKGKSYPHTEHSNHMDERFFQTLSSFKENDNKTKKELLIKFEFMSTMARKSISAYLSKITDN